MQLKKLAAICKSKGVFHLFDRVNDDTGEIIEQWLGHGTAMYPLPELPYLTPENLCALFDITVKQSEKIRFIHDKVPSAYNYDHNCETETLLDSENMTLGYGGHVVRPYITRAGLEFIDNDFFAPLQDVADMLEIYERRTDKDTVYFIAKTGLLLAGVLLPLNITEEKLVLSMENLALRCRDALNVKRQKEREAEEQRAEQLEMDNKEKPDK